MIFSVVTVGNEHIVTMVWQWN